MNPIVPRCPQQPSLIARGLQLDLALLVVKDLPRLDASQVVFVGQARVVIEQVPLALVLDDRVMRRPPLDGLEDPTLIRKGSVRRITGCVDEVMGVSGRVGKVVFAVVLVHPGGLEEPTVMVVGDQGFASLGGEDDELPRLLDERVHVLAELGYSGHECGDLARRFVRSTEGSVEHALLLPTLQLTAPDPAEVEVGVVGVLVDVRGRVDRVRSGYVGLVRFERTFRAVALGDTDPEDAFLVPSGEVEEVFPVLAGRIWCPDLLGHPRYVGAT